MSLQEGGWSPLETDRRTHQRRLTDRLSREGGLPGDGDFGLRAGDIQTIVVVGSDTGVIGAVADCAAALGASRRTTSTVEGALAALARDTDRALVVLATADDALLAEEARRIRRDHVRTRLVATVRESNRQIVFSLLSAGAHGVVARSSPPSRWLEAIDAVGRGRIFLPEDLVHDHAARRDPGESCPAIDRQHGPAQLLERLTPRQRQVLQCLVTGRSNKQIARDLGLREGTIKVHVAALLRGLQVSNRTAAAAIGAALLPATEVGLGNAEGGGTRDRS